MNSSKENSSNGKKKKSITIVVIISILSIIMISLGTYLNYANNPKNQSKIVIDKIATKIKNIHTLYEQTGIIDNYSSNFIINNNIQINKETLDQELVNTINNLNNCVTEINVKQDMKNKKLLFNIIAKLKEQNLLNVEYLIQDSTTYYYMEGLTENYVNGGTNNYFENFNNEKHIKENMNYIIDVIANSIKNSLSDNYFQTKQEIMTDTNKKATKTTLTLDNSNLNTIRENILKGLKKDKEAMKIISNTYPDFKNLKYKNEEILKLNEKILLNVYTNIFGKVLKYEYINKYKDSESKIIYDCNSEEIYVVENSIPKYVIIVKEENNKYNIIIYDSNKNNELAKLLYEKDDSRETLSFNTANKTNPLSITIDSKLLNVIKNKSYEKDIKLNFKYVDLTNKNNIIDINIKNKVTSDVEINKDISNPTFQSSLTEEQKNIINNRNINLRKELAKGDNANVQK